MKFSVSIILVVIVGVLVVAEHDIKPEKIFRHDRFDKEKLSRIDVNNEELQRALEDLRRRVPEYTGYLFIDVIFEIFKMMFLFFLKVLAQLQNTSAK